MTRYRWLMLSLLFFATTVNYMDRMIFSVLIPVIRKDIPMTEQEYGYLTGAFQVAYGAGNILFGKFIDSVGTRLGFALAIGCWSAAAALQASALRLVDLGFWRGVLGLAESGNFPAATKSISEWFPKKDRATAMGICVAGSNVAAMVGPPLFVAMNAAYGWRATFFITGLAGFACLAGWLVFYRKPAQHQRISAAELEYIRSGTDDSFEQTGLGWREALQYRQTWGFALGKFLTDPVWWFYLYWLPVYLFDFRGLDLRQIGWALPVIYLTADAGSVSGGWASGFLMRRGWPPGRARKTVMGLCAACMPIAALCGVMPNLFLSIGLVCLATACHQGWSANLFTTVSDIFPSRAVASVIGIGQALASLGGLLFSSLLPGFLIPRFGYAPVFAMFGIFHLAAFACVHSLMGNLEPAGSKNIKPQAMPRAPAR